MELPFTLYEEEKIVKEIKPLRGLIIYFFLQSLLVIFFIGIIGLIFIVATSFFIPSIIPITIILLIVIIELLVSPFLRYRQQYYWITNKRVIYKKGFIGYSIISVPLERISDIVISRSLIERLCGFGSLLIQSLAGQDSSQRAGAEASLLAAPNPEELQKLILNLVKQKREEEGLKF